MLHPKNSEELSNGEQDDKLKVSCLKPVSAAGVVHDNITLFGCIFVFSAFSIFPKCFTIETNAERLVDVVHVNLEWRDLGAKDV